MPNKKDDEELFGKLSYFFESKKEFYNSPEYIWRDQFSIYHPELGYKSFKVKDLQSEKPPLAYSSKTRAYLKRRVWRKLETLGKVGHENYVALATSVLLSFSDADAKAVSTKESYVWDGSYSFVTVYFDTLASYPVLNQILYGESPRYELSGNGQKFQCKGDYKPGDEAPNEREEKFPDLWDEQGAYLLKILRESRLKQAHEFAVKAATQQKDFLSQLSEDDVCALLSSGYEVTISFVFDLAIEILKKKYSSAIISALLNSESSEHQSKALEAIERHAKEALLDKSILLNVLCSSSVEVRNFASSFIKELDKSMIESLIEAYAEMGLEERQSVSEQWLTCLTPFFHLVPYTLIEKLLSHSEQDLQAFAAAILAEKKDVASEITESLLNVLLNSNNDLMRKSAFKILSSFSEEELKKRSDLLFSFLSNNSAEARESAYPLVKRLVEADSSLRSTYFSELLKMIIRGRLAKETLFDLAKFCQDLFSQELSSLELERVLKLLTVKVPAANSLGSSELKRLAKEDVSASLLNSFLRNDTAKLRSAGIAFFEAHEDFYAQQIVDFVPTLDSDWEDTQEFMFTYFQEKLETKDFDIDLLVAVCDSTNEKVQKFGRDLMLKHFQEEDALDYLIMLSEHPSANIQLFISSFLEKYSSGEVEEQAKLLPFIERALGQVNRGGVLKKRLLAFIEGEIKASAESAKIFMPLLFNQSASYSVELKSDCLKLMFLAKSLWPDLESPLKQRTYS